MLGRAEVVGVSKKGVRLFEAIEESRGAAIVDMVDVVGDRGVGSVKSVEAQVPGEAEVVCVMRLPRL